MSELEVQGQRPNPSVLNHRLRGASALCLAGLGAVLLSNHELPQGSFTDTLDTLSMYFYQTLAEGITCSSW